MGRSCDVVVLAQFRAHDVLLADQNDSDAQRPGSANGSLDLSLRGVIAAHCVNRDGHHGMTLPEALFFRNLDHFAAFVAAAMRAGAVGKLRLVAIGALGAAGDLQMVVGPAGGGALLGVSAFRIWHVLSL